MKEIVELKVGRLADRLSDSHRMAFTYDEKVIDQIAARCVEVETGARNIDTIMQGTLLPRISLEILQQMTLGPLPANLKLGLDDQAEFTYMFFEDSETPAEKRKKQPAKKKGKMAKAK